MNSRVRHLDLRLSLPPELGARSWHVAETLRHGFIAAVVERLAERLHERFGADAIIEIPLVEMRWDGTEKILVDFDYATVLGDEAADDLLSDYRADAPDGIARVSGHPGEIRVYRSRAHKAAVVIGALARERQRAATLAAAAALDEEWRAVCERGSASVAETVACICELEALEPVVESLGTAMLRMAVEICPSSGWPLPARRLVADRLERIAADRPAAEAAPTPADSTSTPPKASPAVAVDETSDTPSERESSRPSPEATPRRSSLDGSSSEEVGAEVPDTAKSDPPSAAATDGATVRPPGSTRPSNEGVPESAATAADVRTETPSVPFRSASSAAEGADTEDGRAEHLRPTRYAGLVYLLNLAMRVELPEILWCCGIDERSFLFDLCRELAGPDCDDDPVPRIIGGIDADRGHYRAESVPGWAGVEVVQKTRSRLARDLSRVSGASRERFDREPDDALHDETPADEASSWSALIRVIARLLSTAFLLLVRAADDKTLESYLRLHGQVRTSDDATVIVLPMDAIDIDVRRVALDTDPAYLPWCRHSVRVEFIADRAL